MGARYGIAASATASLLLLFFLQLVSAQTDPAACSVSCRFVIVPTLGPQGLPGLNGTKGDTGAIGQEGPMGPAGEQGPPGINGTHGIDGKDGINGTNGIDGKDGKDGKDGVNGADGAPGTVDVTSTYTGLKLEAPVLSGAISIAGGALSGATNIGEGATILRPNITGPSIDGATVIGEGATLAKPIITAPKISDAELTGITKAGQVVIGPDAPFVCKGSTNETRISLTIGRIGFAHIGSMIKWADGSVSILIEALSPEQNSGTDGRINDNAVRENMDCLLYNGRNNLVSSTAYTKDGATLIGTAITSMGQPVIHHDGPGGARLVKLSLDLMNTRNKAFWSFPAPPNAGIDWSYNDTFVGLNMAQTITNKVITTSGRLTATQSPIVTIGNGDTTCNITQAGTLVTAYGGCTFSHGSLGTLITWPDGQVSTILSSTLEAGSPTATVSVSLQRPTPTIVKVHGGTMMTTNFAVFQDKLAIKGFTGGTGSCSVAIDMNQVKGGPSQSVWSFPGPAATVNYFVGEDVTQTLTNKKLDRISGSVAATVRKEAAAGTLTDPANDLTLKAGSNAIAGSIVLKAGTSPPATGAICQVGLGGSTGVLSFVTITPANAAAADIKVFATGGTMNEFYLGTQTQLVPGTRYEWHYHVVG